MLITVVYDGHLRSLSILSYNVFVTNSIAGALELPADLLPILTMDSMGRRWTLSGGLILSGTAAVATGLVPTGLDRHLFSTSFAFECSQQLCSQIHLQLLSWHRQ